MNQWLRRIRWRWLIGILAAALVIVLGYILHLGQTDGDGHFRIGATYMTMNNPFYSVIDEELRLKIESRGDILLTRDPALDQEKQNQQVHELLQEGIDVLVINPVDYQQVHTALSEAKEAGVPVVVVDSQVNDTDLIACTIASDNYGAGVLCAQHLMQTRDSAHIVLLEHPMAQSAVDRIRGFCDTIAHHPAYQIVDRANSEGQLEIAMPELSALLDAGEPIDTVMALNDPSAMGAMAALEEHGLLDHTLVYGVDGAPEAKSMIAEGSLTGTVAQFPIKIGQTTAQTIYQILSGKSYPSEITIPVEFITSENLDQFDMDDWQ